MSKKLSRRYLLGALMSASLLVSACGFRLRGHFTAPFDTLYLQMRENTPLSDAIYRQLTAGSNIRIVKSPDEAQAILELVSSSRNRDVLSINAAGRAREYELTLTIEFRISSPDGYEYMETTRLTATRDITYSESDFLSRESEEALLYRDMESDIVAQLIRHIEAIKPQHHAAQ